MRILVVEDERLLCDGIAEDLRLENTRWIAATMVLRPVSGCLWNPMIWWSWI